MIMEFEENLLDVIVSECTSNTLFDEYINYEQIVSESIVLSENQQIKLSILREFSIKDIGKRLADAFKAIKTFISNLILKLNVFIKNIGKDKIFKDVGKALTELDPEKRKEKIEYNECALFINHNKLNYKIKRIDSCINFLMSQLKSNTLMVDVYEKDIDNRYGISNAKDLELDGEISIDWMKESGTRIEAYKNYTEVSKKLDKEYDYFTKLSNKISSQADKLEKLADRWKGKHDGDIIYIKSSARIVKKLFIPAMKANVTYLKNLASEIADENKRILTEAIGLIKGDKFKRRYTSRMGVKLDVDNINDSTNESYTPWNDLD